MIERTLRTLTTDAFMFAFAAVFLSYADLYAYYAGLIPIPAAYIFLAVLLVVGFGALAGAAVSRRTLHAAASLYRANFAVMLPLASIVAVSFATAFLPGTHWDEGSKYVTYPTYDAAVVLLAMLLPFGATGRRHFRWYVTCAFAIFLATVLVDAARPGTFSLLAERAAGFAQNPNTAAFVLVVLCCAIVDFGRVRMLDLILLLLTSVGTLVTLSRGGGVLLAILLVCYAYAALRRGRRRVAAMLGRVAALAALACLIYLGSSALIHRAGIFSLESQQRLAILLGERPAVSAEDSRVRVTGESVRLIAASPLLGYGSGYTYTMPVGPHNIYLQQWINNGLAGLLAFVWLLVAAGRTFRVRRDRTGVVFTILVAVQGLFSHNLLEERAFLVFLGVLLTQSFFGTEVVTGGSNVAAPHEAAALVRGRRTR